MNNNKFEQRNEENRSKQIEEIKAIIEQGGFTKDEFRIAYEMSLGLSEDEVSVPEKVSDKVKELATELEEMSKNGVALTTISEVLKEVEKKDLAFDSYYAFVESLSITDKEKKLLRSIIDDRKVGDLIISDLKTLKELVKITIPEYPEDDDFSLQLISELTPVLSALKARDKIEVSFIS